MRGDDSTAGCHMAFWSFVIITQSSRLPFHHFQLYSGELLIKVSLWLNFSHLFTYLDAQTTLLPKKDSFGQMILPIQNNLPNSSSFFRHLYCGFISNDRTVITFITRITKSVILISVSVSGNPDFRSSLCAEQPGKMNIKLRMYIRRIVNLLDINKGFGG